jgi:hypothetical protein
MSESKYFHRPELKTRSTPTFFAITFGFLVSAALIIYGIGNDWGFYVAFLPIVALAFMSWIYFFRGWKLGKHR